jgi:hypothetical protein
VSLSEDAVPAHKFAVGQAVQLLPSRAQEKPKGARFKIVRLMPESENTFQYRVKCQADGHERVVREDQLARG